MDEQADRQMETGDIYFRSLGVMNHQENIKVPNRPMDSISLI